MRAGKMFGTSHHDTSPAATHAADGEFPVRDDILGDESGQGYALRMAGSNYLGGLPAVKKMLGKTRFAVLEKEDAAAISRWFGADPEELALAFGATGIGRSESDFELCGHPIGRSYFVNRMYPRVCALCLRDAPYCRSLWDFSLATACHVHTVSLSELCPWCGEGLFWSRPSVTMCKCGCDLLSMSPTSSATALECDLSRWIVKHLMMKTWIAGVTPPVRHIHGESDSGLIRLLRPLTLNGGLQMIYALGTAERCDASSSHDLQRKKSSMAAARGVLMQADAMVRKLMAAECVDFRKSSLSVVVNLLAESAKAVADPADRSLAHSLIYVLLRQGGRSNWKSRHPQLSQFELF